MVGEVEVPDGVGARQFIPVCSRGRIGSPLVQNSAEFGAVLVDLLGVAEHDGAGRHAAEPPERPFGTQPNGVVEAGLGLRQHPLVLVRDALVEPRLGIVGIEIDRPPVLGNRQVTASRTDQQIAKIHAQFGIGPLGDRLAEQLHDLGLLALLQEHVRQPLDRVQMFRLTLEDLLETGERRFVPSQFCQDEPQIGTGVDVVRLQLERR